jgi:hypothetical protein
MLTNVYDAPRVLHVLEFVDQRFSGEKEKAQQAGLVRFFFFAPHVVHCHVLNSFTGPVLNYQTH